MTTALAAVPEPRVLPDVRYIRLSQVGEAVNSDPFRLEAKCKELGIETEDYGRFTFVRLADLDTLVGAYRARSIRSKYAPEFVRIHVATDFVIDIVPGELPALCERRGVLVDRSHAVPVLSYGSLVTLRKLLAVERAVPLSDDDWFPAAAVLPEIRRVQTTRVSAIDEPDRGLDLSDPDAPRALGMDAELVMRARWVGLRWKRGGANPKRLVVRNQPLYVVGFDLFRLLGIAMEPALVDRYRRIMDEAYDAVVRPSETEADTAA